MEKQDWLDWQEFQAAAKEVSRRLDDLCEQIEELWYLAPDDQYTRYDIERCITNTLYRCQTGDLSTGKS